MKAMVTGGCGFIGYNLCQQLERDGHDVLVIDDLSSGKEYNKIPGFEYIHESIQLPGLMNDIINTYEPGLIFHLAAIPRVSFSVENPMPTITANLIGTVSILEALRKRRTKKFIRLINSSSSSIYGGANKLPTPTDYPADPKSPYALQKWHAEEWCSMYARLYDNIDVVSLRYFNVFGPHSYYGGAYSTILSAWLYSLYVDDNIKPFLEGDGSQTRDFCFVDNVVQANLKAALVDTPFKGQAFNIAQGNSYSLIACKLLLERISGKNLNLEYRPNRIGDVDHTLADISESKLCLGYKPEVGFESQVKKMAKWYQIGYIND